MGKTTSTDRVPEGAAPTKAGALAAFLRDRIRVGLHKPGEKLPSIRELSVGRGCSPSTVVEALAQLEREELVVAVPRSGHFVRDRRSAAAEPRRRAVPALDVVRGRSHGIVRRVLEMGQTASIAPFHAAVPDPRILPVAALRRVLVREIASDPTPLARYSPVAGSPRAREELARFLRSRGQSVDASDIVLSNGCSEALSLAIESCTGTDDVVAIESPAFFGLVSLLERLGRRVVEIPVDLRDGIRLDLLRDALERHSVRALVVGPDVQNPTGATMPPDARGRLLELAERHGVTVVEDGIYALCRFGGARYPSLREMASEADVVQCSSLSKTLAPGVRAGWILPGRWERQVQELKAVRTLGGSLVVQDAWAAFLGTRACRDHFRTLPRRLWEQTRKMRSLLEEEGPADLRITDPSGGFVLWVRRPGLDALELFERAVAAGIGIVPGPAFSAHPSRFRDCFRVSCGSPFDPHLEAKARRLAHLLHR